GEDQGQEKGRSHAKLHQADREAQSSIDRSITIKRKSANPRASARPTKAIEAKGRRWSSLLRWSRAALARLVRLGFMLGGRSSGFHAATGGLSGFDFPSPLSRPPLP